MRLFGMRLWESYDDSDPQRVQKDEMAIYIFVNLGFPYVEQAGVKKIEQAACDLLVSRSRSHLDTTTRASFRNGQMS